MPHAALAAGACAGRVRELAQRALTGLGGDDGFYGIISGAAVMALLYIDELGLAAAAIERALAQARHTVR